MTASSLLAARGTGIGFPGVRAVDGVDFDLRAGEVHAIVGENGAGKSTLGKLLAGSLIGDTGEILVDGEVRQFGSPRDALAAGIALIPQELQFVASLSVAENIALGREGSVRGFVDRAAARLQATEALAAIGAGHVRPAALLGDLDPGDRQLVAIARALSLHARCLVMDEPTASLGAGEGARLELAIRQLVLGGSAVAYVSHKLDEVLRLADRVTVMRDGRRVTTVAARDLGAAALVRLMVGRELPTPTRGVVPDGAREVLRVDGLTVTSREGTQRSLHDVSLRVRAGEIVGLAGLVGAGRTDLLLALVGAHRADVRGRLWLDGQSTIRPRRRTRATAGSSFSRRCGRSRASCRNRAWIATSPCRRSSG